MKQAGLEATHTHTHAQICQQPFMSGMENLFSLMINSFRAIFLLALGEKQRFMASLKVHESKNIQTLAPTLYEAINSRRSLIRNDFLFLL
jgi:hypothetical protein